MRQIKRTKTFISIVCAIVLLFSLGSFLVYASDGKSVTATTSASVKQGGSGTCYVYIDSSESLAALDVTVHFDPTKVKISNVYNSISNKFYDSVINTDNIQFNYLLDGKGSSTQTRLFYFYYRVLSNAEIGDAFFDITIGEAYDNSLNDVAVSGSGCKFTITETVTNKTCSVSSSSTVSTSVGQEFSLSYRFSTYQIASGTAVITYDPELFEVVSATSGSFLSNKFADINTNLKGSVYISFTGAYNSKYDLVTVNFKTLKNVSEKSEITFKAPELTDIDLNYITCQNYVTTANIVIDNTYVGDAPKMSVCAEYDSVTEKVTAIISLEADSKLGAGNFELSFDPTILTLSSYEKGFEPTYFNVIDKDIDSGILKFYIISLDGIVTSEKILTVVFDVTHPCEDTQTEIVINGDKLSDPLIVPILLNFIDDSVLIPLKHTYGEWVTDKEPTVFEEGSKYKECTKCGDKITESIPKLENSEITAIKSAIDGTDLDIGFSGEEAVIIVPTSIDVAMTEDELRAIFNDETIEITSNGGIIGTGCKVTIGEYEVDLIVKGDIDGDGVATVFDALMVKKALVNNDFENEALREFAADVDDTEGTTEADVSALLAIIVGK